MNYRTPRHWRWWLTIGINPQARHDTRHYIRRDNAGLIALMAEWRRRLDELDNRPLPEMQPWQRDVFAAVLAAHPSTIARLTHPHIRPGRHIVDPATLVDRLIEQFPGAPITTLAARLIGEPAPNLANYRKATP